MSVQMSEKEARRAGLIGATTKTSRTAAPRQKWATVCAACGEVCAGETAEKRHNETTGHGRFECVL